MPSLTAPAPEEVRSTIERVLASGRFQRSKRASQLLAYLAEATLAGRVESIKAFTIAVDVFGKDHSFDADNDTLVRVQAGRLREMLESYFEGEGRDSPVVIRMPRGGYVLQFVARAAAEAQLNITPGPVPLMAQAPTPHFVAHLDPATPVSAVASAPSASLLARWPVKLAAIALLAIAAFTVHYFLGSGVSGGGIKSANAARPPVIRLLVAQAGSDPHERAVMQSIRAIASRFSDFDTISRNEGEAKGVRVWPEDYRLKIEKNALGDTFALSLSAEHVATGTVVGSVRTSLTSRSTLEDLLPLEQALVKLLQPHGPVVADYQRRGDYSPVMRCVLLREDYDVEQDDIGHTRARDCSEALIAAGVEDPRNYNALAYIHMEEYTDQRNLRPGDPLKRALAAAKRALELAPSSGEAHARLMTIYALTGDFDQMVQAGRRAMELNPADSAAMDNLAARLNYRGQHAEALKLLLRAEQLQPVAPLWRAYAFFLAHYGQGQIPEAIERASTLAGSRNPLYLAARTIVARHRGDAAERADAFATLAREERGFLKTPRAMYERRHYTAPLVDRLIQDILAQDIAQVPAGSGPFRVP